MWSSYCGRLDCSNLFSFSFVLLKYPSTINVSTNAHLIYAFLVIFLSLLFNYSCVLLVYSYKNFLWKATSLSLCKKQRKKANQDTVHCHSCIFTANGAIDYFPNLL